MASPPIPPATVHNHHSLPVSNFHHLSGSSPPILTSLASFDRRHPVATNWYFLARRAFPSSSALAARRWSGRRRAASPGSPSPPESDPPPGERPDTDTPTGLMSRFSKVKDAVRIFFAVFFWMSLFFWSCVWDGKDDGRPNKGFRK